ILEHKERKISKKNIIKKDKLKVIFLLLIMDIADKGPSLRVFFREVRHLTDENIETIRQKREKFRLRIEKIVQEGINQGELRKELRADMISFGILGVTNWSYNWYKPDGEVSAEELIKIYADMILTGIAT